MTTVQDFYDAEPIRRTHDLGLLFGCYYEHLPEMGNRPMAWGGPDDNERVEVRFHYERWEDSRRFWAVASVWLDDRPFMLVQNAGREGDDHAKRFVTNRIAYADAVGYLTRLSLARTERGDYCPPDEARKDLLRFYDESIPAPTPRAIGDSGGSAG